MGAVVSPRTAGSFLPIDNKVNAGQTESVDVYDTQQVLNTLYLLNEALDQKGRTVWGSPTLLNHTFELVVLYLGRTLEIPA